MPKPQYSFSYICPFCKERPLLDRHNAKTCGDKECMKKRYLAYQENYQKSNKEHLRKSKRDNYHEKKESKND